MSTDTRTTTGRRATHFPPRAGALGRSGALLLLAAAAWLVGDLIEIGLSRTDTLSDGWSFVASELVFYAAMALFAAALLTGRAAGLAGASGLGRAGLLVAAIAWIALIVGGVLVGFAGLEAAGLVLLVAGIARNVGEILAGLGILRGGGIRPPGAAVFLVYAIASTLSTVITILVAGTGGGGPGHVAELALVASWVLAGLAIRLPRRGRIWLALALAAAIAFVVSPFIPF